MSTGSRRPVDLSDKRAQSIVMSSALAVLSLVIMVAALVSPNIQAFTAVCGFLGFAAGICTVMMINRGQARPITQASRLVGATVTGFAVAGLAGILRLDWLIALAMLVASLPAYAWLYQHSAKRRR